MRLRRRTLLRMGAMAGAATALPWAGGAKPALAATSTTGGASVRDPASTVRPKFRWWWPDALVDAGEISREVRAIAAAGFGGVEIAAVTHSMDRQLDTVRYGWGTEAWRAAVEAALREAKKRDIVVDLTIGPAWPAAVPSITPDSAAASKELAYGIGVVASGETYDGPLPPAVTTAEDGVTDERLLLVQAVRVSADSSPASVPARLDQGTVTDVTHRVSAGRLAWTAPDDGATWLLVAYWERGSGQRPEGRDHTTPLAYVVDHFSDAGTRAVTDFWEKHILTPPVRALLKETGGTLFEDSIEIETEATLWTPALPAEFERRIGYSLLPYLAAFVEKKEKYVFSFEASLDKAIRRDVMEVVTELYVEHHLRPLQNWAHTLGLKLRIQPYGLETDAIYKSALLDVTEGESLGFKNLDDFRCLAGGRDMGGRPLVSNEAGATAGGAYSTTWTDTLKKLVTQYAAGVNQAVFHGFAYADAPGAEWPGFAAFSPYKGAAGYGEAWGPRQPLWRHTPQVADFLARVQHVLQTGVNKVDIGVLRQKGYAGSGLGAPWFTSDGVPVGWTHTFLSPRLLDLPSALVRDGRLAPDGPALKALLVDGDIMINREHTLQLDVAGKLLGYARAGLPVILIGDWSDAHVPGLAGPTDNDRLRQLLAELQTVKTVHTVADRPDVPEAITALGLTRDVEYAQASMLLNAHRADGDTDYFFFANDAVSKKGSTGARITHDVTLTARVKGAIPYRLDPWTGDITPVARYTRTADDRVRLTVDLQPGAVTVVILTRPGADAPRRYATATQADAIRVDVGGRLELRASAAGTYRTTLDDGRSVDTTVGAVPEPVGLTSWTLTVDDWQPSASATETTHTQHELTLDTLAPWPQIPGLEDVSGIGVYRTTLTLGNDWSPDEHGALLELGGVFDTFRVSVNGRELPPLDQLTRVADLGGRLRPGRNTVEIEVATTLLNRLRVARPAVFGAGKRQNYGLTGPVRLVPYTRRTLRV
ncbi:glycosyl hydrolase [Streptomyces sp. NBC_00120]|uniref:Glycosyl hydrolase n=1 Tax=Streptomyces sp. NBC_00119 TaxID=2975659 RepID=A0AAU1U4X7_9ACTN|nr:glycosyl hydrolase [Streptomyces sp. NBC_00120]MCX5321988.1 glycosyl hydrolase [Streptomyces sp. NBC_00120]